MPNMTLNQLAAEVHAICRERGWWDGETPENSLYFRASKLLLVHSEISEAAEGLRKGIKDDHLPNRSALEVEIVDALIRIFDFAGATRLDLDGVWSEKTAYNAQRADHNRDNRSESGGKKF